MHPSYLLGNETIQVPLPHVRAARRSSLLQSATTETWAKRRPSGPSSTAEGGK